jgi:probable selenate reductase FAD-binding subunit
MIKAYHRPASIAEALALLQRKDVRAPRAAVLAGGTWLNGDAPEGVEVAVDIGGLGLSMLERMGDAPVVRIGAAVTLQRLVDNIEAVSGSTAFGVIAECAQAMAALNIRNQATLGGAIVTADRSSPLVAALLACDAELIVHAPEEHTIALGAFLAYRERVMAEGILLAEVRLPIPSPDTRCAYERVARTPKDYPIVCAVARLAVQDGIAGHVRVAAGGVAPVPMRLALLEFGLEKKCLAQHLDPALDAAIAELTPTGDWQGSAEYRKEMARVLSCRAILRAAAI